MGTLQSSRTPPMEITEAQLQQIARRIGLLPPVEANADQMRGPGAGRRLRLLQGGREAADQAPPQRL